MFPAGSPSLLVSNIKKAAAFTVEECVKAALLRNMKAGKTEVGLTEGTNPKAPCTHIVDT